MSIDDATGLNPREYIAAWNEKYNDRIIADRVRCIRGFSSDSRCNKGIDDLFVNGTGRIWDELECPAHSVYWIQTPRYMKEPLNDE